MIKSKTKNFNIDNAVCVGILLVLYVLVSVVKLVNTTVREILGYTCIYTQYYASDNELKNKLREAVLNKMSNQIKYNEEVRYEKEASELSITLLKEIFILKVDYILDNYNLNLLVLFFKLCNSFFD